MQRVDSDWDHVGTHATTRTVAQTARGKCGGESRTVSKSDVYTDSTSADCGRAPTNLPKRCRALAVRPTNRTQEAQHLQAAIAASIRETSLARRHPSAELLSTRANVPKSLQLWSQPGWAAG